MHRIKPVNDCSKKCLQLKTSEKWYDLLLQIVFKKRIRAPENVKTGGGAQENKKRE